MKKVVLFFGIVIFALALGLGIYSNQHSPKPSGLLALNIEAMALGHEGGTENTGPGEIKICKKSWVQTGLKKFCMSSNEYPCTESECE